MDIIRPSDPDQAGDVPTLGNDEPALIDGRTRGSTASELHGGLGPEDLAITPEQRHEEREPLHTEPLDDPEEDVSTGLGTGRRGMKRTDGDTIDSDAKIERPSSLPEHPPGPRPAHPESW